jgi:hypothetical protein
LERNRNEESSAEGKVVATEYWKSVAVQQQSGVISLKFRALAQNRTNKAIEAILRIGNLSNRQIYEFEEPEVRKIIRALKDAITSVESRFDSPRGKSGGSFKL